MPRESVSLRAARMLESRAPRVAQRIGASRVAGAIHSPAAGGDIEHWTSAPVAGSPASDSESPLIVVVTDRPVSARWMSASLAVALRARVMVARPVALAREELTADAVVGVSDAVDAAIGICRRLGAGRLALVSPVRLPASVPSGLPTTLIQSSATGPIRPMVQEFERILRATGTAVRDTDYPTIPDEWVRLPRLVRGSATALNDLIAFLERGIGVQSTFEVIPGWDLR